MHDYVYLIVNIVVFGLPFLASIFLLDQKKEILADAPKLDIRAYIIAFLLVGTFFIIFDLFFTEIGVWSFNPQYTLGLYLLNLPIEEILFFITIPFASIALKILIDNFFKERQINLNKFLYILIIVMLFSLGIMAQKIYTSTILLMLAGYFVYCLVFKPRHMIESRNVLIFVLISLFPFFVVNYILTSLPILQYNPIYNSGIRITTIPVEDFAYSIFMLILYLDVYLRIAKKN